MLFISIGASIHTFLNYLRLVLMIDVAHLKGLYKGTNLVAVAMDGNNQIVPIAFGICKGETGPCWSWWMSVLKECIGDNPNLLFISYRYAAIALAVEKEFPLAFHDVCCRHLMMNLGLKNKKRKGLLWKICKAYTREDYATNMNTLQIVQPDAHEKLCRAGPQRWSRAHCPLVRYNYMSSNSVEPVNACSVIYRKEPVLKLPETYRAMVQECKQSGKKKDESATWVVNGVNAYQYEVSDGQYIREANLQTGICGCRKWQLLGLLCGHVIAITRFLGLKDCVHYAADWFKKPKYQATYSVSIHSLGNMQQWEFSENIQKVIPLRMDNPQPGLWKATVQDLWDSCNQWGVVIDVYIAAKRSKSSHRLEERSGDSKPNEGMNTQPVRDNANVFSHLTPMLKRSWAINQWACRAIMMQVIVEKNVGVSVSNKANEDSSNEALMFISEDDCIDLDGMERSILAKVKDLSVITDLLKYMSSEGFVDVGLRYVGGRWVWLEFDSTDQVESVKNSKVLNDLFFELKDVSYDFIPDERCVWIDLVGLPLASWALEAYKKLGGW
nr:transposase, MuDR, MULE transposase domain protein [Tanacetum cinerariifolium]